MHILLHRLTAQNKPTTLKVGKALQLPFYIPLVKFKQQGYLHGC